jgi:hypothetical protein
MCLPLPFLGFSSILPTLDSDCVRRTYKVPASRSISDHLSPNNSPCLKP